MAVEPSAGSPVAPPSTNRVKSAGNRAVGSPASESGNGVHCHQCRQKTRDFAAACGNMWKNKPCMVKLCRKCLLNRYGEKVEDVVNLEKWICPKCRGICNCSVCMKQKGHEPTGQLINKAKATGFSSVTEMLLKSAERLNHENGGSGRNVSLENEVVLFSRKRGKENCFDGQLGSKLSKCADKKAKKVKGEHNINGDDIMCAGVSSNGAGLCNGEKNPKRMKTNSTVHKEIMLPLGTDLTSVAGIDVPAEDVGNALEFLEFCSVFKKILEVKNGEAKYLLQEIFHGLSTKRGKLCPIVQFHMHLLSILKTERGEKFASSGSNGKSKWFDVLKICLAESPCVLKSSGVASLEKATDYEALNASEKLRVLNLLCIEVLGMRKLRNWIENQNSQLERKAKEAKQKYLDASSKVKALKQKAKDDIAKAIDSKDGEQEAQQAHAELLESKAMLSKIDQTAHAVRIEPIIADYSGHMYWKLNCGGESEVLHQYVGMGDTLTLNEKWSALSTEEKEVIEKNISVRNNEN